MNLVESYEEEIDAVDAACVSLLDCLRQLATQPKNEVLILCAQKLVRYLRAHGGGTFTRGDLNRIEIGLSLAEIVD